MFRILKSGWISKLCRLHPTDANTPWITRKYFLMSNLETGRGFASDSCGKKFPKTESRFATETSGGTLSLPKRSYPALWNAVTRRLLVEEVKCSSTARYDGRASTQDGVKSEGKTWLTERQLITAAYRPTNGSVVFAWFFPQVGQVLEVANFLLEGATLQNSGDVLKKLVESVGMTHVGAGFDNTTGQLNMACVCPCGEEDAQTSPGPLFQMTIMPEAQRDGYSDVTVHMDTKIFESICGKLAGMAAAELFACVSSPTLFCDFAEVNRMAALAASRLIDQDDEGSGFGRGISDQSPASGSNVQLLRGPPGPRGYTGPSGPPGEKGNKGDAGRDGLAGTPSIQGPPGHVFMIPLSSAAGGGGGSGTKKGPDASAEALRQMLAQHMMAMQGPQGPMGLTGIPVAVGPHGNEGPKGEAGEMGEPGPRGHLGEMGTPGRDGRRGRPSRDGERGRTGSPGEKGEQGALGLPGLPGEKGERGEKGIPGEKGMPGHDGQQGDDGAQDLPGLDGEMSPWLLGTYKFVHGTAQLALTPPNFTTEHRIQAEKMLATTTICQGYSGTLDCMREREDGVRKVANRLLEQRLLWSSS